MTIELTSIDLIPIRLAFRSPVVTAYGTLTERDGLLVRVTAADGEVGWGEASPIPGLSVDDLDTTRSALERWIAGSPRDLTVARGAVDPMLAMHPHAWAAGSSALADLAARRSGRSLADLILAEAGLVGDEHAPTSVAVNALVGGETPDEVALSVAAAVGAEFKAVKLKVATGSVETDLERIRACCIAAGEVEVRLDANGGWTPDEARRVLDAVADLPIAYVEEPVAGLENLAGLRSEVPFPIAVDESMRSMADLEEAMASADVIIIKPQALGGVIPVANALRVLTDRTVVITSYLDGAVGVLTAAHLAAAMAPGRAHGLATSSMLTADVVTVAPPRRGRLHLPSGPGLGVAIDG